MLASHARDGSSILPRCTPPSSLSQRWWFSGIITACHTPWHRIPFTREFTEHADRSRPGFDSRPTHFPPPSLSSYQQQSQSCSVGVNGNILHCLCSAGGSTPSPGDSHPHIPHIPIYDLMVLMATRGVLIAQLAVRFCLGSLQPHPHTHPRASSSSGRAPPSHGGGEGFKSSLVHSPNFAPIV